MAPANVIPLRPLTVGALLEAADRSGLSDAQVAALIDRLFPDALRPAWERPLRRLVDARGGGM